MNTNVVFSIARTGIDKTIPIIPNKFPKIAIVIRIDKVDQSHLFRACCTKSK